MNLKSYYQKTDKGRVVTPKVRAAYVKRLLAATLYSDYEPETNTVDLLADLMHYADAEGFDFSDALATAQDHHEEEVREARTFSDEEGS